MQNKDRKGKWQPFDALTGYSASLREVERKQEKIDKPLLFPDELELLNIKMTNAFNQKQKINLQFYNQGYLESINGYVERIDLINKEVNLKTSDGIVRIKFALILEIEELV